MDDDTIGMNRSIWYRMPHVAESEYFKNSRHKLRSPTYHENHVSFFFF